MYFNQTRTVWFGRDFNRVLMIFTLVPGVTWLKSVLIRHHADEYSQNLPACQCRNRRRTVKQINTAIGRQTNRMMALGLSGPAGTTAGNSIPCAL